MPFRGFCCGKGQAGYGPNGFRSQIMAFTKTPVTPARATPAHPKTPTDVWALFRAVRDARHVLGLRPGHIQTLQALLSFLKPGQGLTVFASNATVCHRIGGIDDRTLRRHIARFEALGFLQRHDSSNRKRYRLRASDGASISYGLCLAPLMDRADELLALAQQEENDRRDRIFLRKQILTLLAGLEEHDAENSFVVTTRKLLRRRLDLSDYRRLLAQAKAITTEMSTAVDMPETTYLPANDGQSARHQSKSEKEDLDSRKPIDTEIEAHTILSVCDQAASFATKKLRNWSDIEVHARTLAPMMGIDHATYTKAQTSIGPRKTSAAVFIILQLGNRIRNLAAYFQSLTLGTRKEHFDPKALIRRLSGEQRSIA